MRSSLCAWTTVTRCCWSFELISNSFLRRLQVVQNAAAGLVTDTRRHQHITPVMRQLHWLPLRQRNEFQLVDLVNVRTTASLPLLPATENFDRPTSLHAFEISKT